MSDYDDLTRYLDTHPAKETLYALARQARTTGKEADYKAKAAFEAEVADYLRLDHAFGTIGREAYEATLKFRREPPWYADHDEVDAFDATVDKKARDMFRQFFPAGWNPLVGDAPPIDDERVRLAEERVRRRVRNR